MRISDWSSDVCSSDLEPDAHGHAALAVDADIGDAGQILQAVAHVAVGVVGDLDRRVPVAGEGNVDDRPGVGLDLGDDRFLDLLRQARSEERRVGEEWVRTCRSWW